MSNRKEARILNRIVSRYRRCRRWIGQNQHKRNTHSNIEVGIMTSKTAILKIHPLLASNRYRAHQIDISGAEIRSKFWITIKLKLMILSCKKEKHFQINFNIRSQIKITVSQSRQCASELIRCFLIWSRIIKRREETRHINQLWTTKVAQVLTQSKCQAKTNS